MLYYGLCYHELDICQRVRGEVVAHLDVRQLEYFAVAAKEGSYASAAKALFVSPQAISKGVQLLERSLGLRLFDRTPGGIGLTEFGKRFYEGVAAVFASLDELEELPRRYLAEQSESISFGLHTLNLKEHGGVVSWPDLLGFREKYPFVNASFSEMHGDYLVEAVLSGALDFAMTILPDGLSEQFDAVLLQQFQLYAIVADPHFLENRSCATFDDLTQGWLLRYSDENIFNDYVGELAAAHNSELPIAPLSLRTGGGQDVLARERYYALVPSPVPREGSALGSARMLPVVDASGRGLAIPHSLFWKKGRVLKTGERALVSYIEELYAKGRDEASDD